MSSAHAITQHLIEEGTAAKAHFQIWWALRNLAIPKYLRTMSELSYVDFFHASNAGHYKLFFISLSKIFDRDDRVAGISQLKKALRAEGRTQCALRIARALKPLEPKIKSVLAIRNKTIAHNEYAIPRKKVYDVNGITPNELREIINVVCEVINGTARELGITNTIFDSDRGERATLAMLETLQKGHAKS
ncbi:hypothetical protein AB4156_20215 [Cupriavidus sp. 2MCAB6]|uniref:AbiU2 domain-containing protein n=1 Tax=Cupriavidus sp. 2MCAB6 TaxID=3232981 RepID=UPI003F919EC1